MYRHLLQSLAVIQKVLCVLRVNFERHFWIDTPMFSQVFFVKFWKLIEILFQVVDMAIVVEVISQLEKYAITKEALEVILFLLSIYYTTRNQTLRVWI